MHLTTSRLVLRPFTSTDLDAMYSWQSDPAAVRYLNWPPMSAADVHQMLHRKMRHVDITSATDAVNFAVVRRADDVVLGEANLQLQSREHNCGEIGYILHPRQHGRGYATETAHAMLELGFEHYRMHRIVGRVDAENTASLRVLTRLGMRCEAHLLDNEFIKGQWRSEALFAMLLDEWNRAQRASSAHNLHSESAPVDDEPAGRASL